MPFEPVTLAMRNSQSLKLSLLLASLLSSPLTSAQEEGEPAAEVIDPNAPVTIQPSKQEVINEFRVNGQLYMICVNPTKGRTYCLVDADGDGNLETRKNDLSPDFLIPSWVLKRW